MTLRRFLDWAILVSAGATLLATLVLIAWLTTFLNGCTIERALVLNESHAAPLIQCTPNP